MCRKLSNIIQCLNLLAIVFGVNGEISGNDFFGDGHSISKCCPKLYYMSYNNTCVQYDLTMEMPDFSELDIYDYDLIKLNKTVKDLFRVDVGNTHNETIESSIFNTYLIEDGSLQIEVALPNTYKRFTKVKKGMFCVDYVVVEDGTVPKARFWYTSEEVSAVSAAFVISALVVSFILLTLSLVVFMMMRKFGSLFERVILSMVSSLMGACGMLALQSIVTNSGHSYSCQFCLITTFVIYFFILSSFCWMNVLGFHLWCRFRCEIKSNNVYTLFKYCCFAWGVPLVMGIALIVINQTDLSHVPWIIKPNIPLYGCFLSGYEKFFYLYVPLLVLLAANWVVVLIMAYKLRHLRPMKEIDVSKQQKRFVKYLHLSLVMSLVWILEIINFAVEDTVVCYMVQICHVILCLTIFLILFCNRRIVTSVSNRLYRDRYPEPCQGRIKELHSLYGEE